MSEMSLRKKHKNKNSEVLRRIFFFGQKLSSVRVSPKEISKINSTDLVMSQVLAVNKGSSLTCRDQR